MLKSGDLILIQADQVEPALAFIEEYIATNSRSEFETPGGGAAEMPSRSDSPIAAGESNGQMSATGAANGVQLPAR